MTNTQPDRTETNRRNAQHSTGPVTPAGKAALRPKRAHHRLVRRLPQSPPPTNNSSPNSNSLARRTPTPRPPRTRSLPRLRPRLLAQTRNRRRAKRSHSRSFLDETRARQLDRLHRYERDFERRAARHLATLRRLQSQRPQQEAELYSLQADLLAALEAAAIGAASAASVHPPPSNRPAFPSLTAAQSPAFNPASCIFNTEDSR